MPRVSLEQGSDRQQESGESGEKPGSMDMDVDMDLFASEDQFQDDLPQPSPQQDPPNSVAPCPGQRKAQLCLFGHSSPRQGIWFSKLREMLTERGILFSSGFN
ncbi:hypothetical protein AAFF_G00177430 [Aldrovandia affinis]|uniref:Uncharacterized protein n=1 Tax=Aldrovandia affinis TaxID=143900 RepID=A0AAD7W7U3_9TELE|nr:hypothetical protein AAFF_G00177430 [Aldrovandia affinis]